MYVPLPFSLSSSSPLLSLPFSLLPSLLPTPFLDPSFPPLPPPSSLLPSLLPPFLQTTQSTDLQSLIGWLLDHTNLEVPEVDRPSLPIVPEPPKPSSEEPSAEGAPELSESSSDSSDYSDDSEEDESGGMRWPHSHTSSPVIGLGFHQSSWHGKRVAPHSQALPACELQATESWAGPGNEARKQAS